MAKKKKIDWDKFYSAYKNMKRVGNGTYRKLDMEGLGMVMDALQRKGFNDRQIEAILGNVVEESGGDPYAVAKGNVYKGLFQESNVRYPMSEFEKDKKRFKGKKKEYIDYMIDRFYEHVNDSKYYTVKGTKYNRAKEAVKEFTSNDKNIDYSYPLVYAFEAPGDKEGTYKNRKSVSNIISKSYLNDDSYVANAIENTENVKLNVKNNGFGAAFKEARKGGLSEFIFDGKKYSTRVKEDGGPVSDDDDKWWEDEEKRKSVIERQNTARKNQENFRKLEENARKALEDDDINEGEYRNIIGFAESPIGSLIVEKTGKGEEIADMINRIIDSGINEKAFGEGVEDASDSQREKRMDDLYDYKLMANSLLTLADIATASPGALRVLDKFGVSLHPILKTIANNRKIQIASGVSGMMVDGAQIALNPDDDNIANYAGIIGAAAEVIGGTDVARGTRIMRQYGDRIDDILDVANPIITTGGIASDLVFEDGGDIKQKQKKAYDYFTMKRGMSQIQALAILGNLMAESELKDDIHGDNGTSYGIQQWHNERKDALFKMAKKKGHDVPTFEDQLEFLADEYEGKTGYSNFLYARKGKMGPGYYNYSRSDFQDAENLRDAVVAWNQGAGRPHKSVIRNSDRYSAALKVAKNLGFDFGLDSGAAPMYGQMGVGEDFIFHEEGEDPAPDTQAVSKQDTVSTTQEDMMKSWIEAYGKGIVAQLMATSGNNKVNTNVDDTTERYRDYVKESKDDEDSKRMALLQSFLPNIQLKIKGVTQVRGDQ